MDSRITCPKCQGAVANEWLAEREAQVLPVPEIPATNNSSVRRRRHIHALHISEE
jgi:hypothetical protein